MPLTASGKPIEHIQFFKGQQLYASDLQDLEEFNHAMRWLHNQSLHQAGVASGYAVTGNKGDSQITIQPGYAIDATGREIVLERPTTLQVPPVANDGAGNAVYYDLVVSYTSDASTTETRDGVCVPRGAVRLREVPTFCWAQLVPTSDPAGTTAALSAARRARLAALNADIESGNRIRLARAEVLNCQLNQPLSIAERRNARPSAQPYIAAGNTLSAAPKWDAVNDGLGISLSTSVDTSSANFRSLPQYFANIVGGRSIPVDLGPTPPAALVVDGFLRIDAQTLTSLSVSLVIPAILIDRTLGTLPAVAAALATALNKPQADGSPLWYVAWMGVEG